MVVFDNKTAATSIQWFALQGLVATYGLSYASLKSIQMVILKEMLIAIIDTRRDNLLGEELLCTVQSKVYAMIAIALTIFRHH